MANVSFYRGSQANLDAMTSYQDGRFYLTTDTDRLYVAQSASELVELNKSITVISNANQLPQLTTDNSKEVKGSAVAVGQFYYVNAGADSVSGNILAVCESINGTHINWVQVNPDTNINTKVTSLSAEKSNTSTTGQLVYNLSIGQTTYEGAEGASGVAVTPITATLTISAADVAQITTDTAIDLYSSAVSNNNSVTISTTGVGATGNGMTLTGGDNITLTGNANALSISAVDTTYTLASPAVSGATAAAVAVLNLGNNETNDNDGGGSVSIKTGEDLAINNTTANEFTIYHKNSGVTSGTYGHSATATLVEQGTIKVPKITVDAQGHITSVVDEALTLPADSDTKIISVTATSAGKIILHPDSGSDIESGADLFYTVTQYTSPTTSSVVTTYNQGSFGSYYTKEAVDSMMQGLDAMTYKGTVGTAESTTASLPTSGVKNGDTYLASADFGDYKKGDLIIATGNTETNGVITGTVHWTQVQTDFDTDTTYSFSVASNTVSVKPSSSSQETLVTIAGGNALTASTSGKTITLDHDASGVVSGSSTSATAGPTSNVTLVDNGTVSIPQVTVDKYGHVTSLTNRTITLNEANTEYTFGVDNGTTVLKLTPSEGSDQTVTVTASTAIQVVGTTNTLTISHANVSTTATNNGGTNGTQLVEQQVVSLVTGVTVNDQGHVTNVTTTKYKLPEDTNTQYTFSVATGNTAVLHIQPSGSGSNTDIQFDSTSLSVTSVTANHINMDLVWGTF